MHLQLLIAINSGVLLTMKSLKIISLLAVALLKCAQLHAHDVAGEATRSATNFLAALTPEKLGQATFALTDAERENWHFIPRARKGLAFRDMTLTQQGLARILVSTPLSHRGFYKVETIMSLEQVLYELENHAPHREPGQYFVSIFGTPGVEPWGWRIEGHHLSLNFLAANGGAIATSPAFLGSNPAEVRRGPRAGLHVLEREEELAWKLVRSLDTKQASLAIISTNAPEDILTSTNRHINRLVPAGIAADKLSKSQAKLLRELVEEFARRNRPELADAELERIDRAGADKLFFAWAGPTEAGRGHYYRIQGRHFIIEFANTQNNANHVHTVWRDLENDFGDDLLKRHYESSPHSR
jgi:hypothetical protein